MGGGRRALWAALLLCIGADARELGFPFLHYYSPKEYGAAPQNWAVAEDKRGVMFFGNSDCILEYDGVSWRKIKLSNASSVRSLAVDAEGTVYAGGQGEFGYLKADAQGALRYVSLLEQVPQADRRFADVWSTVATPQGIYFGADSHLFRWSAAGGVKVWKPARRFRRAFQAGGVLYIANEGVGLQRISGDSLQTAPGGEQFASGLMGGTKLERGPLMVAAGNALYREKGGLFERFHSDADPLLSENRLYSIAALPDGNLAVGTEGGGLLVVGPEGALLRLVNKASGLGSETVRAIHTDRRGGTWLGLDSGLARVELWNKLSLFDERSGLRGAVLSISRHEGVLYAGTMLGLYRMRSPKLGQASFEPVEAIEGTVIPMLPTEDGLLVGSNGLRKLRGGRVEMIWRDEFVSDLFRSTRDPSIVYGAGRSGVAVLRRTGGSWKVSETIRGSGQAARSVVEDSDGRVWFTTKFEVFRLTRAGNSWREERFEEAHGLPQGWKNLYLPGGRVVVATEKGLLHFDEGAKRFVPDPAFGNSFADGSRAVSLIRQDAGGSFWISGSGYNGLLRRQSNGQFVFDTTPLARANLQEIYGLYLDDPEHGGAVWASGQDGMLVRYEPGAQGAQDGAREFRTLLRRVGPLDGSESVFQGAGAAAAPVLSYQRRALRFEFAAPFFEDDSRTECQVFLDGSGEGWSQWTTETRKDYTNLPEGNFVFRVRARNLYGAVAEEAAYGFRVLPPWFRTWWAYLSYALAGCGAVWGLLRWRLQRLQEEKRHLEELVALRTEEILRQADALREANQDLNEANTSLAKLNEEKNEFLGIAAHDLKNPLGGIRGYAQMLREDAGLMPQEEVVDMAQRIEKGADLMFHLVSNLLDINRIEQGQMTIELKPCSLWEVARQSVDDYQQRAEAKAVAIRFVEGARAPDVLADEAPLTEVVDNLVSNAVKYSPSKKNVYVRVAAAGTAVRLEVRDEGPGISEADRARLFQKFARLSARPTAGEHSTGLGLAIVKRMVEAMNGKVWCESELGKGATFLVELPAAPLEAQPAGVSTASRTEPRP